MTLEGSALGHVSSSTDFMLPQSFLVELMGDRATLRQELLQWLDTPLDLEALAAANPFPDVRLQAATDIVGRPAIRIDCTDARLGRRQPPSVSGRNGRIRRAVSSRAARRRSACSRRRRRWKSAWRPIGPRTLGGQPVSLPLIVE
mgnify:CR=1 FL=1